MGRPAAQTYREAAARLRLAAQLVKRAVGHDDAPTHDGDAIRHQLSLAEHMGRDDERGAACSLLAEISPHVLTRHRVWPRPRPLPENSLVRLQAAHTQGPL